MRGYSAIFLGQGRAIGDKYHLLDWSSVCKSKEGDLGFRSLQQMNQALREKWLWRNGDDSNGLWIKNIVACMVWKEIVDLAISI